MQEGSVGNPVALTKTVRQPQRVKTDIAAQDSPAPRQAEEIGQLSGAASGLEHDGTLGQLVIEGCRESPLSRLRTERLA